MIRPDVAENLVLLLRCANGRGNLVDLKAIPAADWPAIVRAATVHGVAPYLYVRLATAGLTRLLPGEVVESLRDSYQRTSLANLKIYQELPKALSCLARHDIPVLLLKGAHLARFVYPYEAMRPMEDIDLLVRPADYTRAGEILMDGGYRLAHSEDHWGGEEPEERHIAVTGENGTTIELHRTFDLSPTATRASADDAFARAGRVAIEDVEAYVMAPEDLLLHVAMHASFQHGFGLGMLVLCDIGVILECFRSEIDWDAFISRTFSWAACRGVWLTLVLARELVGVGPSLEVLGRLHPAEATNGLRAMARSRILAGKKPRDIPSATLAQLYAQTTVRHRLGTLARRLFPPRQEVARLYHMPYDSPKIWFFYAVRLRDVGRRHLPTLWRLVRGDGRTRALAEQANDEAALRRWLHGTEEVKRSRREGAKE
ncbi:MAG: nucleotidyltransferase family protein [Armatimonadetes bacterium]|nr:nucleotidyltransferase family protein [Armatimonadota bacterium]